MKKIIKVSKELIEKFNNACNVVVDEFSSMEDESIVFEQQVKFNPVREGLDAEISPTKGAIMDIQVVTCANDTCYVQGVLYINGKKVGYTEGGSRLNDVFTVNGYTVAVTQKPDVIAA